MALLTTWLILETSYLAELCTCTWHTRNYLAVGDIFKITLSLSHTCTHTHTHTHTEREREREKAIIHRQYLNTILVQKFIWKMANELRFVRTYVDIRQGDNWEVDNETDLYAHCDQWQSGRHFKIIKRICTQSAPNIEPRPTELPDLYNSISCNQ